MAKDDKTNVMRLLEQAGIPYAAHYFDPDGPLPDEEGVFKTLVTEDGKGGHHVFVVPIQCSLDLKKAARAAGVKSIAMIRQKELLPLTGYVHGGCSPLGMKKPFPTFIDEIALISERFCCSAGRRGAQVELDAQALAALIGAEFADITE
ncbi:MAG: aminoacyl-tRNA deacylase [Oscillospiraceae bacterium]|nr:aminoacyl-tRNA deacylase [Oscillospiraceae bacterium]